MKKSLRFALASAAMVAVAALTISGCSSSSSSTSSTDSNKAIVVGVSALGTKWGTPDSGQNGTLFNNLHGQLVRKVYAKGSGGAVAGQNVYKFEGYLAKDWDVSSDGKTYTFHLRTDVKNKEGDTMNADDVVYSYQRKFAASSGTTVAVTSPVLTSADQVTKVDDSTVSFTIPSAAFGTQLLALLADYTGNIYDSTLLKKHASTDDPYAIKWSDTEPNYGYGPYIVDGYKDGQYVDYVKNPGFPKDLSTGAKHFRYQLIADAGTELTALQSGDIDIATSLLPSDVKKLQKTSGITVPTVENPNEWLIMPMVTSSGPFKDARVRQALAYAVPYDKIISDVYYNRAKKIDYGPISSTTPGYSSEGLNDYSTDTDKAKELLNEAGYADGVTFTLTIDSSHPDLQSVAILIQTEAAKAGFTIKINPVSNASLWAGVSKHSFDAYLMRDYAITQTQSYVMRLYTQPGSFVNLANWEDKDYYDAETAAESVSDQLSAEAGTKWAEATSIMLDQMPIDYMMYLQPTVAYRSNVKGFTWRTDNLLDLTQITRK